MDKSYVTCDVSGDIGTQLAQIMSVVAYAKRHKKEPVFNRKSDGTTFWSTLFGDKLNVLDEEEYKKISFNQSITNHSNVSFGDLSQIADNVRLSGSFRYFESACCSRKEIIDLVYSNEDLMYEAYARYNEIKDKFEYTCDDDFLSMYIDTKNKELFDMDFYRRAYYTSCDMGKKKRGLVAFTDDVERCKELISLDRCVYIDINETCANFIVMSLFDNNVIGESLTALYASFLSPCRNKIVIASHGSVENAWRDDDKECNSDASFDGFADFLDDITYV